MEKNYQVRTKGILSWAEEDRPREKLLEKGRSVLSNAELIGILLGSGTADLTAVDLAKKILGDVDNNLNLLAAKNIFDLTKYKGVGEAKAINIITALEIGRRRNQSDAVKKESVKSSVDVYNLMKPHLLDLPHEEFWIVMLNRANKVIKKTAVSLGGISGTIADPKIIFSTALQHLASSIILVHNHPSGNLKPSQADVKLTRKLKESGEMLDLPVLDHLIFGDETYYSFADEDML